MNRGIYSTAQGMIAAQHQLDVVTNNLANLSTVGYKKDGLVFSQQFEREIRAGGGTGRSIGTLASGPTEQAEYTEFEPGPAQHTGAPLDVAIQDTKAAFAVQTSNGIAYTRDGSFTINADRILTTKGGLPVLDDRGTTISVPADAQRIAISETGQIQADGQPVGSLGLYQGNFEKTGSNLYNSSDAKPLDTFQLITGAVEGSNVNAIESMTQLISLQRAYELAQKSISQQDESAQRLIQSLSNNG